MQKFTQDELMEALNHMDGLADISAEEGEEKRDLQKSYEYIAQFIETYANNTPHEGLCECGYPCVYGTDHCERHQTP